MNGDLLVVTPVPAIADAIRQNLQETGPYRIHIVNNKADGVRDCRDKIGRAHV